MAAGLHAVDVLARHEPPEGGGEARVLGRRVDAVEVDEDVERVDAPQLVVGAVALEQAADLSLDGAPEGLELLGVEVWSSGSACVRAWQKGRAEKGEGKWTGGSIPRCATATISLSCWATRRRASSAMVLQRPQYSATGSSGSVAASISKQQRGFGELSLRSASLKAWLPGTAPEHLVSPALLWNEEIRATNLDLSYLYQRFSRRVGGHCLRHHAPGISGFRSPSLITAASVS